MISQSSKSKSKRHKLFSLKNHPFVVPVVTFMTLFFISMIGFIIFGGGTTVGPTDSRVVNVYVDGIKQTLPTRAQTVEDLLNRLSINIEPKDVVEPALDAPILTDDFNINIYRARPVVIVDGNKQVVTNTPDQSPRIAARNAGIVVYPEDNVYPEVPEDLLQEGIIGERYVIDRATPVTLVLYGNVSGVRTQAKTVGDLLNEKGIEAAEGDTVEPARNTPLSADLKVIITRPGQKIATVEESIPPPIEYVDDPNLDRGVEEVREPGTEGKKVVTYDIKLENDVEVERVLLQEIVTVNPQRRLVARGTKIIISNPSENVQIGQSLAATRGWTGEQFYCLYQLWQKESGWSTTAGNPSSGAYGIPQALPGTKMATVGSDWRSNPATQISWGMGYIAGRYGTPCAAWSTSQARGWY
ncbi:DUF348 domain-containing protein [Candidatus Saccharibacteria bacterium]|nr:DUF348 domain-containing protein [Candidatus Saccharibacteria bacterium]